MPGDAYLLLCRCKINYPSTAALLLAAPRSVLIRGPRVFDAYNCCRCVVKQIIPELVSGSSTLVVVFNNTRGRYPAGRPHKFGNNTLLTHCVAVTIRAKNTLRAAPLQKAGRPITRAVRPITKDTFYLPLYLRIKFLISSWVIFCKSSCAFSSKDGFFLGPCFTSSTKEAFCGFLTAKSAARFSTSTFSFT